MSRRYDLGSVVGKITFTYDKNGVMRARDDMGRFVKNSDEMGDASDRNAKRINANNHKIALSFKAIAIAVGALAVGNPANIISSIAVAISQLAQAAPLALGALAGLGAFATTIALGVDGIKKAFEGLKPTLDTLKGQVSATFEAGLAPAIRDLKAVLPQLTQGFKNVAGAIAATASSFTAMLRQQTSVNAMNNILKQTAQITTNVGKAAAPLGQAFLSIASIAISFITPMTAGLGSLAEQFNKWVQSAQGQAKINDMINTGIQAFKVLFGIISQVGGIIVAVFQGLSTSTGMFGQTLVDTLQAVKEFLRSAEGFNALQAIGQALQDVGVVVRTILLTALRELAPAIPPLLKAFSQLAQQVMPPVVKILEIVGPIVVKLAEAIADNINWIGPLIIALGAWAAAQWVLNAAMLANPIGLVLIALAALVAAVALVITNWDSIAAFFKGVWDDVWKWTSDRITDVRNFIVSTWDAIYKWLSDRLTDIRNFFVNIWNDIVSFFVGIGTSIGNAVGSVIDWFASIPAKIGNFLASLPGTLWNAFVDGFKLALNAVIQGIEWIIAAMIALPLKIMSIVVQVGTALVNGITSAFNWLVTNIPVFINNVITFFSELPSRIVGAIIGFSQMMNDWFTNTWNSLTTNVSTSFDSFVAWWNALPDRIIAAIQAFGGLLLNWITTAWNTAYDWAVARGAEFISWALGLPGRIIDAISRFIQDARNWATQSFQALWDAAVQKAAEFINWARGLPDRIASQFSSLFNRMVSIGGDIVRGIWQGIQNLAGWLWNQVTGFVGGIVSKVKSLLSIGSPSKVFADEVGRWIPAGIAQGISDNAHLVVNSIQDIFDNAVPNVNKIVSPLGQAAQEILNQLSSGGNLFEDFSFKGNSNLVSTFNDQIASMFYASGNPQDTTGVADFLKNLVNTQTSASPAVTTVTNSSSSGDVVIQNLNVAGNLDPTNPTQWRQALVNIKDGIREVERQYV